MPCTKWVSKRPATTKPGHASKSWCGVLRISFAGCAKYKYKIRNGHQAMSMQAAAIMWLARDPA